MADVSLPWQAVTTFFTSAGVIYAFALNYPRYYLEVISNKAFLALGLVSLFSYFIGLLFETYNERLNAKLKNYPEALNIVQSQGESLSTFLTYTALLLSACWVAWLALEALIRSLESFKKRNSE